MFFFSTDTNITLTSSFLLSRANMIFVRPYVTKAYVVKHAHASELEKLSKGAYKKSYPVTTDTEKLNEKQEVPFYNQPTHGKGPLDNPSKPLHSSKDLEGNDRPQNAVSPKSPFNFPEKWLSSPIKGSDEFYEQPGVRNRIDTIRFIIREYNKFLYNKYKAYNTNTNKIRLFKHSDDRML